MAVHEIPLSPNPQTFRIQLAGVTYLVQVIWRDTSEGAWFLDLSTNDGAPIVQGISIVTGADLLAPSAYLGIDRSLDGPTDQESRDAPTHPNLRPATPHPSPHANPPTRHNLPHP